MSLSNDDITALVHTDLNLFPMYGEINLQKQSEKTLKLSELEKEIDDIKADQEAAKTEARIMLDNSFKEDMLEFIEKLKVEFPKMKSAMLTVSKNRRLETSDIIEIKPDLVITLKECCKNMKIISQVKYKLLLNSIL